MAHDAEQFGLQTGHLASHANNGFEIQTANGTGVECDDVGNMAAAMDCIQANDFTGQIESQHPLLAIALDDITLEAARPNGGHGVKFISGAKQVLTGMERP